MNDNILVDTSVFYALIANDDRFHEKAKRIYADFMDQHVEIYTTSYVLVESMALIHRRLGFSALDEFVDSFNIAVTVFWVDGPLHQSAWEIVKAREGRGPSLVDCTVLILARSLKAAVFAFDEDFAREGLDVIP